MTDYAVARHNMVQSQVRTNKVTDERLLAAMSELPRERFLPQARRGVAYVDEDIPIDHGRYLMEPMVLGRLLQSAEARPDDLGLVVGCATGYDAAVLARLCGTVVALENVPSLVEQATALLAELGVDNAAVVEGSLVEGYPKQAPYDVILFAGAVGRIPDALATQLADGGRMLAVVANGAGTGGAGMGRATLFVRRASALSKRVLFDAATPPLADFENRRGFVF